MGKLRSIPVIALCAIYIFMAAGVALLSSSVYRAVEDSSGENSDGRVALSYVLSQLRAGDTAGGIRVLPFFGDGSALAIADGENYETLLYCYEGNLMELFAERDLGLGPETGMVIAKAQMLTIVPEGNLLHLSIFNKDGRSSYTCYRIQSGEVILP